MPDNPAARDENVSADNPDVPPERASQPINGSEGTTPDLRVPIRGHTAGVNPTNDGFIHYMLGDACKLLWQVARITAGVLDSVRLGDVRKICAADLPCAISTIREDGAFAPDPELETIATDDDPAQAQRKQPRGRMHPLMMLMRLGVQAARLLKQIAAGAFPEMMNAMSVGDKLQLQTSKTELAWERFQRSRPYSI